MFSNSVDTANQGMRMNDFCFCFMEFRVAIGLELLVVFFYGVACSNKYCCSPVLCLESEAKNPFPLFSRLLRLKREGLGCKHIFFVALLAGQN